MTGNYIPPVVAEGLGRREREVQDYLQERALRQGTATGAPQRVRSPLTRLNPARGWELNLQITRLRARLFG